MKKKINCWIKVHRTYGPLGVRLSEPKKEYVDYASNFEGSDIVPAEITYNVPTPKGQTKKKGN